MDVGVRELKQHLSEYLDRAAAGETIRVTNHGRPKAVLAPLPAMSAIERGIAEGWVTPATRSGGLSEATPENGSRPTIAVLRESRDD